MATAQLAARRETAGELLLVALTVPPELARAYTAPGQYIEVTTPGGNGYFVLGSNVGASPWELLVRNNGDAAAALYTLPLGSAVEISLPMGAGFPVAAAAARPVVVAVVASALAVARPIVALRSIAARATFVFLGVRAPTDVPLPDEVAAWCALGITVVLCLSRSELEHHPEILPEARRAVGYVQTALARAVGEGVVPPGALVVAAGPEGMLVDLRGFASTLLATDSSVPPIEVVTNV